MIRLRAGSVPWARAVRREERKSAVISYSLQKSARVLSLVAPLQIFSKFSPFPSARVLLCVDPSVRAGIYGHAAWSCASCVMLVAACWAGRPYRGQAHKASGGRGFC